MSGFTEAALVKKLTDLNPSQQSIQTLSLWLIHHRKHHSVIVKVWMRELVKGDQFCSLISSGNLCKFYSWVLAKEARKLTFMYLANDVIQNGKKKGTEFGGEFEGTLKRAFEHLSTSSGNDDRTKQGILKILKIWEDRGVYEHKVIKDWKTFFGNSPPPISQSIVNLCLQ